MASLIQEACIISSPFPFILFFFLVFLHIVMLKYDAYIRLTLLLVILLTPLIYPGQSMLMTLAVLLRSMQWDVT